MMKQFFAVFLALVLMLGAVPVAMATETEAAETTAATEATKPVRGEFECGDDMVWAYEDGVLTITGSGEMDDYEEDAPWAAYKDEIESVIFVGGVTYIGARAFKNYDSLKTVDFGAKLKEIGMEAFWSCEGLTEIELPATFKTFGESSFLSCNKLEAIHCSGTFPSFKQNSMWDCYATIYYPAEKPWSVNVIAQLEEAFKGRIEFLASDGTDHYIPVEETTVPAETEAPTELPTEAPTEAPSEAATEVTTVPAEETVAQTTAPAETEASTETTQMTQPSEEEKNAEETGIRFLMIGFGVAVGLTLVVAFVMVLRQLKKGGKYSR